MSDTNPQPDDPPNLPVTPSRPPEGSSMSPNPRATTAESRGSSSANIGGIIGGVVAGVIAVVILVTILVPFQRRRRIRQRQKTNHDPPYDSLKAKGLSEFGGLGAGNGFLIVDPERSFTGPGRPSDHDMGGHHDHKFGSMRPMRYITSPSTPDHVHPSHIPSLQASVIGQYNQSSDSFDPYSEHGVLHPTPPPDARTRTSATRDVRRSKGTLSKSRKANQRRSNLAPPIEISSAAALPSSRVPSPPPTVSAFPSILERTKSCSSMALSDSADTTSVYSQLSMPHSNAMATQRHSGVKDQGPSLGTIAERLVRQSDPNPSRKGKEPLAAEPLPPLPLSGPQPLVSRPPRSPARPPPMPYQLSSSASVASTSSNSHGYVSSSYTSPPSNMSHPAVIVLNSKGPDTIAIHQMLQSRAEQRFVGNAFGPGHLFHGSYSDDGLQSTRSMSSHDHGDGAGASVPNLITSSRLESAAPHPRRRSISAGSVGEAKVEEDCYGKVVRNPVSRNTDSKRSAGRDPAVSRLEAPRGSRAAPTRPKHKHSQSTPSFPILPATTSSSQGSPSNTSNPNIMRPRKRSGGVRPRTASASSTGPVPIKRSPSSVNLRIKPRRDTSADSPSRRRAPSVGIIGYSKIPNTASSFGSDTTPKATSQLRLDSPRSRQLDDDEGLEDDYDSEEDEPRKRFASMGSSGSESILLQPLPKSSLLYPSTGAFGTSEPAMRSLESPYHYTIDDVQAFLPRNPPLVTTPKKKYLQGGKRGEQRL
ncbi:hypothetical protein BKA70DRAFT_745179 [Coprinopsis sp. MPI-PUGE-AT-0042]|nr:hypothetical protein BKA70DRAFT_745179 [Coprinopsis sp. MPI-PUGE-AT-0042]